MGCNCDCPCYWGCGSTGNRVVWVLFFTVFFTGVGLAIYGGAGGKSCFDNFKQCTDAYNTLTIQYQDQGQTQAESASKWCTDLMDQYCHFKKWIGCIIAGCLLVVLAPFTWVYFCFCARNPNKTAGSQPPVVVAAAPMAVPIPGGQPYPYPPQAAPAMYPPPAAPYPPVPQA